MSLDSAIKQHLNIAHGLCAVGILIEKLPAEDRKALLEAIDKNFPTQTLVKALRQEGYRTSDNNFNVHRQGKCRCPKSA
jgi:hypothetical protein